MVRKLSVGGNIPVVHIGDDAPRGNIPVRKISGTVETPESVTITELVFGKYAEFPKVGAVGKLYISTEPIGMYMYDTATNSYINLSSGSGSDASFDPSDVKKITCKLPTE